MGVSAARMVEINKYLSRENLEKYLKVYSANYIATRLFLPNFKTTAGTVIDRAKLLNIETHTVSSSKKLKTVKIAQKKTMLEKYGVENISQAQVVKDKKTQKALDRYGCVNVFQSEEIKKKSKQTMLEKYGVGHTIQLPNFIKNNGKLSKNHKEIFEFLKKNKIKCKNEVIFSKYNKHYKRIYSPRADICIESKKIVIEVNGDIWHANPKLYKKNDLLPATYWSNKQMTAKDVWKKDKIKRKHIESFGYRIIYVWDKDFNHNKNKTLQRLLDEISKN